MVSYCSMKTRLLILPYFLMVQTCSPSNKSHHLPEGKENKAQLVAKLDATVIGFDKEIKPIFIKNCSPCHFAGGKMYEKLPFDQDTTIINHSASILKRIKNEEENTLLNKFITQNKKGLPGGKP
jgi:hypothetical protein